MRTFALTVLVVLLASCIATGENTFHAGGSGMGKVVLWFLGSDVAADVDGGLMLAGSFVLDGEETAFTVHGTTTGSGWGDMATLVGTAWLLVDASGATADGEPISIRGGLTVGDVNADASGVPEGTGNGLFLFTLLTPDLRLTAEGVVIGSASGVFVAPEIETTMQLSGSATFELHGDVRSYAPMDLDSIGNEFGESSEWNPTLWPEDLLEQLLEILDSHEADTPT